MMLYYSGRKARRKAKSRYSGLNVIAEAWKTIEEQAAEIWLPA